MSRLKRIERELSVKEKQLLERESKIRRREADLEKQLNVVVSAAKRYYYLIKFCYELEAVIL